WLIPFLPLVGTLVNALFGRATGDRAHWVAVPALGLAFLVSCAVFLRVLNGETYVGELFPWIAAGAFKAAITVQVDQLSAVMLIVTPFGTLDYGAVFANATDAVSQGTYLAIALLLFTGACGKSAQLPLHTWLPDAMEGPTPVSALIHAATMVTAGVYMVARCHKLFEMAPLSLEIVAWVGGLTALFAATIGLVQTDIKRVLAYSTISQLGYMFAGVGVGA